MSGTFGSKDFQGYTGLVVDDEPGMARLLGRLLRELGFKRVDQAQNGQEALEKLQLTSFDLVISDWTMAPVSGLELLRQIRADARHAPMRFIMVTGKADADEVRLAKAAGVDGYLLKPFNVRTLRKQLDRILHG